MNYVRKLRNSISVPLVIAHVALIASVAVAMILSMPTFTA